MGSRRDRPKGQGDSSEHHSQLTPKEIVFEGGADAAGAVIGAGIGLAIAGPPGALVGGLSVPAVATAVWQAAAYAEQRQARVVDVIGLAAQATGLTGEELIRRLEQYPGREELFFRTLAAAADSATRRKLVALSRSLATGVLESRPGELELETLFVKAIAALDEPHLTLLERFAWSSKRLGLGSGDPGFDQPPRSLNLVQMRTVLPDFDGVLESPVATLEREGLITSQQESGFGFIAQWRLTSFGREVLDRLRAVGEVAGPAATG